jgi:hypothetical protein
MIIKFTGISCAHSVPEQYQAFCVKRHFGNSLCQKIINLIFKINERDSMCIDQLSI